MPDQERDSPKFETGPVWPLSHPFRKFAEMLDDPVRKAAYERYDPKGEKLLDAIRTLKKLAYEGAGVHLMQFGEEGDTSHPPEEIGPGSERKMFTL